MFKEVADIQTADMLQLPVPKAHFHNVAVPPSDFQRDMVADLARRAERVRAKEVEPHEDNMLTITNDGRKLALDQRLANPMLPDDEGSKVSACADNVYRYWEEHQEQRLTQLVFCDLSIPKQDGSFNVYDELRRKLMEWKKVFLLRKSPTFTTPIPKSRKRNCSPKYAAAKFGYCSDRRLRWGRARTCKRS